MKEKDNNYHKVLKVLYQKHKLTKLEISQLTGLSIPTVTKNTDKLMEDEFIRHVGVGTSSGGRRPALFTINDNARYSIGVDISPDRVRIILTNIKLKIIERRKFDLNEKFLFDEIMKQVLKETQSIIEENNIDLEKLLGIGISVHGIINRNKMVLSVAPNMSLKNIDFRKYTKYFPGRVNIENEANCGVIAEKFFLPKKDSSNVVYLSINEGLGSGVVINRKLFNGTNRKAGEFGHMKIGCEGRLCGCGSKDCWETYCSERAILKEYKLETGKVLNDVDDIFKLYEQGNESSIKVVNQYIDYLADGIRNVILIMDPETVIIGGRMAKYKKVLQRSLEEKVYEGCNLYSEEDVQIIFSNLHEDASIIGAALTPINCVLF